MKEEETSEEMSDSPVLDTTQELAQASIFD